MSRSERTIMSHHQRSSAEETPKPSKSPLFFCHSSATTISATTCCKKLDECCLRFWFMVLFNVHFLFIVAEHIPSTRATRTYAFQTHFSQLSILYFTQNELGTENEDRMNREWMNWDIKKHNTVITRQYGRRTQLTWRAKPMSTRVTRAYTINAHLSLWCNIVAIHSWRASAFPGTCSSCIRTCVAKHFPRISLNMYVQIPAAKRPTLKHPKSLEG